MYDEQAGIIKIEDIANDDQNRAVLNRIKGNKEGDHCTLAIQNEHDDDEDIINYVPEGAKDMGWLGYFVGKSDCVDGLCINGFNGMSIDIIKPFLMGINNNKSIYTLEYNRMHLSSEMFTLMGTFFKNNKNISNLHINNCIVGVEGSRALALALGSCKNNSLIDLNLMNNIADEGMVDIITSLSMHSQLQEIDFEGNSLRKNGCIAMATLLEHSITQLQTLDLGSNELDDESIEVLVPALKNCNSLNTLRLFTNHLITKRGWKQLSSVLESPNSNISEFNIEDNDIDDEALTSFADALKNNRTLVKLYVSISSTEGETRRAFSNLLCDTSTINSTFLSNHTLLSMFRGHLSYDREHPLRPLLQPLLILNGKGSLSKKKVAMIKILQYHNDFDMTPFFEWEFKVLPLMINWFERASCFESMRGGIDVPENFEPNIGPRKLSCIYQFVRGMPVEYVETCLMKELEDIKAAESREKVYSHGGGRAALLAERKRSIMERLGHQ